MLKKSKKDPKIILESEKMTLSWENIDVNIPTATGCSALPCFRKPIEKTHILNNGLYFLKPW